MVHLRNLAVLLEVLHRFVRPEIRRRPSLVGIHVVLTD